jgi:hypothetical protein
MDSRRDASDVPTAFAKLTASSHTSFVYLALGIRFIFASVPQLYETLASTFFNRPQLAERLLSSSRLPSGFPPFAYDLNGCLKATLPMT